MTTDTITSRPFEPGTLGWTADDLDDPETERRWFDGHYEIVEGVLTTMPAAYFAGGEAVQNLVFVLKTHVRARGVKAGFATEADIVVSATRVPVADAAYLDAAAKRRQADAVRAAGRPDPRRTRLLVPPTLVIECVSPGHELHDRQTKRRWYAEFGVPNYWLLDAFGRSLDCLALDGPDYRVDAGGRDEEEIRPSLFPGLVIPLAEVWEGQP